MSIRYDSEAADRLVAAASKVEASLWIPGVSGQGPDACPSCGRPGVVGEDLSIKSHDVLGLASPCDAPPSLLPNSQPGADIGWPPAGHEPPTAAEWYEPEGAQP